MSDHEGCRLPFSDLSSNERNVMTPNNHMHLTGYSGLRPLSPAGDAER